MLNLSDVCYVKRITIGSRDPESMLSEEQAAQAMDLLNRCLTDHPKGRILGTEKAFSLLNVGEHQVVLQCVIYHVGFTRRPTWLLE